MTKLFLFVGRLFQWIFSAIWPTISIETFGDANVVYKVRIGLDGEPIKTFIGSEAALRQEGFDLPSLPPRRRQNKVLGRKVEQLPQR